MSTSLSLTVAIRALVAAALVMVAARSWRHGRRATGEGRVLRLAAAAVTLLVAVLIAWTAL